MEYDVLDGNVAVAVAEILLDQVMVALVSVKVPAVPGFAVLLNVGNGREMTEDGTTVRISVVLPLDLVIVEVELRVFVAMLDAHVTVVFLVGSGIRVAFPV